MVGYETKRDLSMAHPGAVELRTHSTIMFSRRNKRESLLAIWHMLNACQTKEDARRMLVDLNFDCGIDRGLLPELKEMVKMSFGNK